MTKQHPDVLVGRKVKKQEVEIDDFLLAGRAGDARSPWNLFKAAVGVTLLVAATWGFLWLWFFVTQPQAQ